MGKHNSETTTSKIEVSCSHCGKKLRYKPSHFKKQKTFSCSRKCRGKLISVSYLGDNNPNKKYKIDTSYFKEIDSPDKAYFLGWIASDGSINQSGFSISIKNTDELILRKLRDLLTPAIPIKSRKNNMVSLTVSSKQIAEDLCKHLRISPGKKAFKVAYPDLEPDLHRHFIRGLLDGDGHVSSVRTSRRSPECGIASGSRRMVAGVIKNSIVAPSVYEGRSKHNKPEIKMEWRSNNCLDFLSWLYEDTELYLARKKDLFRDWSVWVPGLSGSGNYGKGLHFRWTKGSKTAVPPKKIRASDSGYDLSVIRLERQLSEDIYLYDTGIKIKPEYGWWFMLTARSSLSLSGYQLANGVGIIDRSFVGTVKVVLRKIDKDAPNLQLPARVVQIVPLPIVHMEPMFVDELSETARGTGGFGSSGLC